MLIDLPVCAELFHTANSTAFADLMIDGHRETWPIRSALRSLPTADRDRNTQAAPELATAPMLSIRALNLICNPDRLERAPCRLEHALSRSRLARRLSRCAQGASRQGDRSRRHQDAALRLRLWRWLGALDQDRAAPRSTGWLYPRLIKASGRCPPEDVGGPWGYAEFLDAIRDPAHERHAELKEWIGCDFDPDNVDSEELAAHVVMLAKQVGADPGHTTHSPRVPMLAIAATRCDLDRSVNEKFRALGVCLPVDYKRREPQMQLPQGRSS